MFILNDAWLNLWPGVEIRIIFLEKEKKCTTNFHILLTHAMMNCRKYGNQMYTQYTREPIVSSFLLGNLNEKQIQM